VVEELDQRVLPLIMVFKIQAEAEAQVDTILEVTA
jgi:hypothetical protein